MDKWYEDNPNKKVSLNHGGGWPVSDLTPQQKEDRSIILVRLANLVKYYSTRLNLQADPSELSTGELRQFVNFSLGFKACEEKLQSLGGLPARYAYIKSPPKVMEEIESQSGVAVTQS